MRKITYKGKLYDRSLFVMEMSKKYDAESAKKLQKLIAGFEQKIQEGESPELYAAMISAAELSLSTR